MTCTSTNVRQVYKKNKGKKLNSDSLQLKIKELLEPMSLQAPC